MNYRPEYPGFDNSSLCRGAQNCALCDKCKRLAPGPQRGCYFVYPPAHGKSACAGFLRRQT